MSDIQDKINQILSNPEAMKQVRSLGEQLGLDSAPPPPPPKQPPSDDNMLSTMTKLAPLMKSFGQDDETTALLNALRPFLGIEKQQRLEQAQRMIKLIRLLPLIKDSGMFF